jgi:hypothetical protein
MRRMISAIVAFTLWFAILKRRSRLQLIRTATTNVPVELGRQEGNPLMCMTEYRTV